MPSLPVPFSQFFLSEDKVLCRCWAHKKESVAQVVIPKYYVPALLQLVHDGVIACHPGKEHNLTAARTNYLWPTMCVDFDSHVFKCEKCAQHKGTVPRPGPTLEYLPL